MWCWTPRRGWAVLCTILLLVHSCTSVEPRLPNEPCPLPNVPPPTQMQHSDPEVSGPKRHIPVLTPNSNSPGTSYGRHLKRTSLQCIFMPC